MSDMDYNQKGVQYISSLQPVFKQPPEVYNIVLLQGTRQIVAKSNLGDWRIMRSEYDSKNPLNKYV